MTFHSEHGEDRWIFENIPLPAGGVYLDIGCNHRGIGNNTEFLRSLGWSGLCVDADHGYAPEWEGVPFVAACVGPKRFARFQFNGGLSRIGETGIILPCVTIPELIEFAQLPRVDFISIDIEGGEYDALKTAHWDAGFRPRVIVSEFNTAGIGEDFRPQRLLESLGYQTAHQTVSNQVFVFTA